LQQKLANAKVIDCFVVGILYLVAAFGIIRKKYNLALAGVIACVLFVGLYIYQLIVWPNVNAWIGFVIFGGLSLLFGIYSWRYWQKRDNHTDSSLAEGELLQVE
jgi:membrane protein implicated in regulation of membrane protease activity